MKLTEKDKDFLEKLKRLLETRDLSVELKSGRPSYMVLRGTYGQAIPETFRISRQGVRWRFWHIFNETYVQAFECILAVEKAFGTGLRDHAIRISKERHQLRQELMTGGFVDAASLTKRNGGDHASPEHNAQTKPTTSRSRHHD